jgi:hypothetical protein
VSEESELERLRERMRGEHFGYRRDGTPITSPLEWTFLQANLSYVHVRCTMVGDVEVSTVWVGMALAGGTPTRPLIFETMVFGGKHDDRAWRYATEDEADAGHDVVVELVRRDG